MSINITAALKAVKKDVEKFQENSPGPGFFQKLLESAITSTSYQETELSSAELKQVKDFMLLMRYGQGAFTPLICRNESCPFRSGCPLYSMSKAPAGNMCPIELDFILGCLQKWADILSSKEIDTAEPLYNHYIGQLAYLDVMMQRARWSQACGYQNPVVELMNSVGRNGEMEISILENPVYNIIDRLHKMQLNILTNLAITPREEYKKNAALKKKSESDLAIQMYKKRASLKEKLSSEDEVVSIPAHLAEVDDGRQVS